LGKAGVFIVLDNIENLEDQELSDILITFRDTLFSIPKIWWVIIGQSGLGSLIQTLDPRVSDRLSGTGLELKPISLESFHKAIEGRVARFHAEQGGKAPLTKKIHEHLYKASHGEIRFVFKYCGSLCTQFIKKVRIELSDGSIEMDETSLNKLLGKYLVKRQIKEELARMLLRDIIRLELEGLNLRLKEKVLRQIGKRESVRAKDFKELGFSSMQELSGNYLSKLYKQHLLIRKQEGRAVQYSLRGLSSLSSEFGLLDS
jgi:Cdc6-like AAA superfamily ATPase